MTPRLKRMPSTPKQKYGLIAAVRNKKCLYDTKNATFKSNNKVWDQVAAQSGIKRGQTAKVIWKNICDAYTAYRKNPIQNGNKTYNMLFEHMKFIDPYIITSNEEEKSTSKQNTETEVGIREVVDNVETLNMNETTTNREFTTIQYWNDTKDDSENVTNLETKPAVQPTNEACSEFNSDSETEVYEDIILPNALNNGSMDNSLKMFFDAMFASTCQLPQVFQRTVKKKIFTAILEAEEEAEKQKTCATMTNCILIKDD